MTVSAIRQALVEHLGQVLTPDVARALEMAAIAPEDRSIDPRAFGQETHGEYVIAAERFADVLPELHPLHELHWGETEAWRHRIPLNPDYAAMKNMERGGRLVQFTVRHQGVLVGNLRLFLSQSLHTQTPICSEDSLYITPDHRGGFLAMALIRFAERALISLGIDEFRVNSKLANKADVLMRRMKYQPVAIQFVKILEIPS